MAHKTLIGGTAYKITGGRDLIDGTGYAKKSGKVLIGGTTYEIGFEPSEFTMTISGGNTTGTKALTSTAKRGLQYTPSKTARLLIRTSIQAKLLAADGGTTHGA